MVHIVDWFILFTLMIVSIVILERASKWLRSGRQKRTVLLERGSVLESHADQRDSFLIEKRRKRR